jgi:hypothetical protein
LPFFIYHWPFEDLKLAGFNDQWPTTNEKWQFLCIPAWRLGYVTAFLSPCLGSSPPGELKLLKK